MKHIAKPSFRLLAAALVAVQLFAAAAGAAFDSGFAYSYPVGAGLSYTRSEGRNSAGLQKANILTYTPNTGVSPVMVYADEKLYGSKATITNAVKYLENQGKSVIGGVNADFFVMSSGIPIGLVIDEGELISSDAWQYAVGFKKDGTAVMGQPTMGMRVTGASGTVSVSYFNKTRTTAGAYLLDHNYDDSTHFSANGTNIILERVDGTPVTVNGTVKMKVINKGTGNSPLTITENQMVLTKSDGADVPSWVDFPIGEEVTLSIAANDSNWSEVEYAVGGKLLMNDGTVTTAGIDAASSRRARSAVGVKADGSVVLYEVDGDQSSHSVGLTAAELGEQLKSLGCVRAVCLDGGGSSAMALRQPGEGGAALISKPSDGSQRACANYIFFVNNVSPDGVAAHAVLTPSYRYIMPGASTWFSVKGADSSYGPAAAPDGLSYTVSGELGTVDGQTFTAGSKTGNAFVTASNGSVEGSMTLCVTGDVNSITLQSGDKDISSISVKPGQSIDVNATGYHQGLKMASADASFTWSVSGRIGTVDEKGVFTAGQSMASGTLTCAYGATKKTIDVSVGMGDAQDAATVADFESTQPCTATSGMTLSRVTDYTAVARGEGSLKAAYDGSKVAAATISLPETDVSGMKYLTLWARGERTQGSLTAVFTDAAGGELTASLSAATTDSWKQLTAAVPAGAAKLTGIRFDRSGAGAANSALYLDQIVVSADHAVTNADAPKVSLNQTALTINANAAASITGTATMENGKYPARASNISVKVDGKAVSGAVKMSGSALTVTTGALAAGTHCVTIDVSDDAGNRTRVAATVTAGSASSVFADTATHWARGYASLLNAGGIMQGETQDGKTYFRPDRNLRRMEFAVTMARILGLDTSYTGKLDFADDAEIPGWARGAVYAVSKAGIMNGQTSGGKLYFSPNADMTRAEVMTVIGRSLPRGYAAASLGYKDAASIPSWAVEQVKTCVSAGIIGGYKDNTLQPLGKITRGEIAKVLALF
ncbi:MAG: phosphodiester glycosidase family protein [Eubacteriales bacterium]|nr:phosphodiester glycosidase family protein [Eubacteriales bacterium]